MTIAEFAVQVHCLYPAHDLVYIAILFDLEGFTLEVEIIPESSNGGCYHTGSCNITVARELADELEDEFVSLGKTVVRTRKEWLTRKAS